MSQDSLEKVQQEVNRVLELLGRVFVAAKSTNKTGAVTAIARLQQALPPSINKYHNALDELEAQLHFARLVMRRDLALATQKTEDPIVKPQDAAIKSESAAEAESIPTTEVPAEPSTMIDLTDDEPMPTKIEKGLSSEGKPTIADADTTMTGLDDGAGLKLDTTQAPEPSPLKDIIDLDKAPDTAISNNADMDSLFNDPISATEGDTAADAFDFDKIPTTKDDFDFDAFSASLNADNNGTSTDSLVLPDFGADDADPDFSALFQTSEQSGLVDGQAQPSQGDAPEFNFDDIMDFSMPDGPGGDSSAPDFELDFS